MDKLLHDTSFIVAAATIVFFLLLIKKVFPILGKSLDERSAKIEKELDEALRLKEEAQALLSSYQRQQVKAEDEAEEIITNAKEQAELIVNNASKKIKEEIEKRTALAEQKIAQAESDVIRQIHDNAVDVTISAARTLIIENLSKEAAEIVMDSAISDIGKKFH